MAARVHHLNCGTMRPWGGALWDGRSGALSFAQLVSHCLLVETTQGLFLIDAGFGLKDALERRKRLGLAFLAGIRPALDPEESAAAQIRKLGYSLDDVRHIALTHLDPDHAGGIADFSKVQVHVCQRELGAALAPASFIERQRYRKAQWEHGPLWQPHDPEEGLWMGLPCARLLPDANPPIWLVDLSGHTRGHCGVAVENGGRWLLHCGDAYFSRGELEPNRSSEPTGMSLYKRATAVLAAQRQQSLQNLRQILESGVIDMFCAHDAREFEALAAGQSPSYGTAA